MNTEYYCVTVNGAPFSSDTEYEAGNYSNIDLAIKIWRFLLEINDDKNIEIKIKKCIVCNKDIIMIQEKLDRKEYLRLINIDIPINDINY
jgi:uncharacterized protein YwlG (UPF0340 family)